MAARRQITSTAKPQPKLKKMVESSRNIPATEEELREQRMSLAFGLCQGQYDVTELSVGLPQSACNAASEAERETNSQNPVRKNGE